MKKFIIEGYEVWADTYSDAKEKYRLWCLIPN